MLIYSRVFSGPGRPIRLRYVQAQHPDPSQKLGNQADSETG